MNGGADGAGARDVDDGAPAVGHHARCDQGGEAERPLQVEADHLVPHGLGDLAQVTVEQGHAGIVDEDVDATEGLVGGVHQSVELLPSAHVGRNSQRPPPPRLDLGRRRSAGLELSTGDDHIGAGVGQAEGHGPAQPPAPAGHQGHLPGQVEALGTGGAMLGSRRHHRLSGGWWWWPTRPPCGPSPAPRCRTGPSWDCRLRPATTRA